MRKDGSNYLKFLLDNITEHWNFKELLQKYHTIFLPFRVAIGTTVTPRTILMTWTRPMVADAHSKRRTVKGMEARA